MMDLRGLNPIAVQAGLTVGATAVGLTLPTSGLKPSAAMISVYTANVRYLIDGTTVTATTGHLAAPGDTLYLLNYKELTQFSAIREGGTSATLEVTYYK